MIYTTKTGESQVDDFEVNIKTKLRSWVKDGEGLPTNIEHSARQVWGPLGHLKLFKAMIEVVTEEKAPKSSPKKKNGS